MSCRMESMQMRKRYLINVPPLHTFIHFVASLLSEFYGWPFQSFCTVSLGLGFGPETSKKMLGSVGKAILVLQFTFWFVISKPQTVKE